MNKIRGLLLVLIFLTSLITLPQVFVEASDLNYKLSIINPNSYTAYVGTMPLNFTVDWSPNGPVPWFGVQQFSYAIDDGAKIPTNGAGNFVFGSSPYIVTTTTNDIVDISNLTSGLHKLTIFADGAYNLDNLFVPIFNYTFSPVYFSVNILTPTPTPTASPSPTPSPSPSIEPSPSPSPSSSLSPTTQPTSTPFNLGDIFTSNIFWYVVGIFVIVIVSIIIIFLLKRR